MLAAFEGRRLLLVLDNCEHLIEDAARITALLLSACPGARVLATSREALGITGEVLCSVPPLATPYAVRLFLDRAAAVRPGGLDGVHARVARICEALDGLPLAIELAAARLRTLTLDELAARLGDHLDAPLGARHESSAEGPRLPGAPRAPGDDRFRLLSRGDRTKAPRHRALRAVVEWSWQLLDDEERRLARRLTVFSGGAALDAVEAVCGVPYPEDVLASLAEKSFLEAAGGRYRMLQTIRAFCAEQLDASGERDRLRDAHAAYFLTLAEDAEPRLRGHAQVPWLAALTAEQGNLDTAVRHLLAADPPRALRLMAALSWFWRLRGLHGGQVRTARDLLAAVGGEPPEGLVEEYAVCLFNSLAGDGADPAEPDRLARADELMGTLTGTPHRPLRLPVTLVLWSLASGPRAPQDLDVGGLMGTDPWGRALLGIGWAFRELFRGRIATSEAAFAQSLEGFRATGDRWGMANCLDPLGMFADWRGERDRALMLLDEGLRHVRALEAPEETADLLLRRAAVLLRTGDLGTARRHLHEAAALARGAGVPDKEASARRGLGDADRLSGDPARARVHYEQALELCAVNWFSACETTRILIALGRAAAALDRPQEAEDWFAQARTAVLGTAGTQECAELAEAMALTAEGAERTATLLGAGAALRADRGRPRCGAARGPRPAVAGRGRLPGRLRPGRTAARGRGARRRAARGPPRRPLTAGPGAVPRAGRKGR
ncbi:hypothetical protein Sm713_18760 [Streptomyces sp. TS71-3]|nr:hypothetical protein Sm713_18760 [Streptomyces sp. TS71-3]